MPLPSSVIAKLDHAKLHLDSLNAETSRYISSCPGEMVANFDSDPNIPTFVYREKDPVPDRISLLVGDCLQNLRSAFDYLVWELVLVTGKKPTRDNMFPISRTEAGFKNANGGKAITNVIAGSETVIQSLQPYTHADPSAHWLYYLNKLTNINKHRRILLTTLSGFSMSSFTDDLNRVTSVDGDISLWTTDYTKTRSIFTADQVNMESDLVTFVAFNEGSDQDMEVGMLVESFIGITTNALKRFELFFS